MHDIKHLEEEWELYHKKKRRPYYVMALVIVGLVSATLYAVYIMQNTPKMISVNSVQKVAIEPIESKVAVIYKPLLDEAHTQLALEKNISIEAVKPVVQLESTANNALPTLPIINNIPILEELKNHKKTKVSKSKYKKPAKVKPRKKVPLKIVQTSSDTAYKEVEKRFKQFQDSDDSLFLARSYYAQKKYKKAELWALKTNKVDNDIEESWIIFAKSKVHLGHKKEAIYILTKFIQQSGSTEAKVLLSKLKK